MGLKESDVDNFVDDVLVNHKPWASRVQEPLTGPYVFICALMSRNEWNRYRARVLIDKFKQEAELRGLTDQVFVTACFHIGDHKYDGNLVIYSPGSDGSITNHWYGYIFPSDVPKLLDQHIGKGEIIERHWRGQIGASSDETKEINDRELPIGEENKKIEDKPQGNSNQIHQEKGNQIENSENGESKEKQLKETRESKSSFVYEPTCVCSSALWGLKESDVDSFVDDVLVNHKPWASRVQEALTGPHVFVCALMSREEWNRDSARVLIDKFKEEAELLGLTNQEAELLGLTNQVFVTACYHTGGHNGNLIIYSPGSNGSITNHWYGYVTPADVPKMLDQHI